MGFLIVKFDYSVSILGLLSGNFHFPSNFSRPFCKQSVSILISFSEMSDLGLHSLPKSHKRRLGLY